MSEANPPAADHPVSKRLRATNTFMAIVILVYTSFKFNKRL